MYFSFFYLLSQEFQIFFDCAERPSIVVLSAEPHKNVNFRNIIWTTCNINNKNCVKKPVRRTFFT